MWEKQRLQQRDCGLVGRIALESSWLVSGLKARERIATASVK